MKKHIFAILAVCFAAILPLCATSYTVETVPNVQKADRTRYLSNPDGIVSPATQARIDSLLADIRRTTSAEVAAVIVDDIGGEDIEEFATGLFRKWGLGKADNSNGVLLVVSRDSHEATIRTGYGAEEILPDALCGRIMRRYMFPRFKEDDYDGGMLASVQALHDVMTDPDAHDRLMSDLDDNYGEEELSFGEFFTYYLLFWLAVSIIALIVILLKVKSMHNKTRYEKYRTFAPYKPIALVVSMFGVFIPLIVAVPLILMLNRWRNGAHSCPNCGGKMHKLDEMTDNEYLTPAQDKEEQLGSVDYDVWLCDTCGETDIYPFENTNTALHTCRNCGAKTAAVERERIVKKPTTRSEGVGERDYYCHNCQSRYSEPFKIARLENASAAPLIIGGIAAGRGGRGGFGGGGNIGGGFGGGFTGGGGATGRW